MPTSHRRHRAGRALAGGSRGFVRDGPVGPPQTIHTSPAMVAVTVEPLADEPIRHEHRDPVDAGVARVLVERPGSRHPQGCRSCDNAALVRSSADASFGPNSESHRRRAGSHGRHDARSAHGASTPMEHPRVVRGRNRDRFPGRFRPSPGGGRRPRGVARMRGGRTSRRSSITLGAPRPTAAPPGSGPVTPRRRPEFDPPTRSSPQAHGARSPGTYAAATAASTD